MSPSCVEYCVAVWVMSDATSEVRSRCRPRLYCCRSGAPVCCAGDWCCAQNGSPMATMGRCELRPEEWPGMGRRPVDSALDRRAGAQAAHHGRDERCSSSPTPRQKACLHCCSKDTALTRLKLRPCYAGAAHGWSCAEATSRVCERAAIGSACSQACHAASVLDVTRCCQ